MGNFVGIYYDTNANLAKVVIADDDNYAPHAEQGYLFVPLNIATYNSLPGALNMGGIANPNDLNKAMVNKVSQLDQNIGAKLQSNITATDAAIAAQGSSV